MFWLDKALSESIEVTGIANWHASFVVLTQENLTIDIDSMMLSLSLIINDSFVLP